MSFHIKIGNYRFSKNLGTGSFGKVKSKPTKVTPSKANCKSCSGFQRDQWSQGSNQDHEQEED